MTIYKVHIRTEGNRTAYTVNETTLATIDCKAPGQYVISNSTGKELAAISTAEEADKMARDKITAFMARLGIVPDFIS